MVALAVSGIAILAFGAYAASIISLSKAFSITVSCTASTVGYFYLKNRVEHNTIENKDLKPKLLDKIATDLRDAFSGDIDGKLILFGCKFYEGDEPRVRGYESITAGQNKEDII